MLRGSYSATLKGGASGVQAADGRTMGDDYSWSFTLEPYGVSLPIIAR